MIPKQRFPFLIYPYEQKLITSCQGDILKPLEKIVAQNDESREKISKLLTKIGFLQSSFEEFLEKEQEESEIEAFFRKLIPLLNNLHSLKQAVEETGEEEWKKGVAFFYEKLLSLFSEYNLKISAERNMPFDPALHEAVGVEYNSDMPDGSIISVIENGWIYNSKVLRFAKVVISKENE